MVRFPSRELLRIDDEQLARIFQNTRDSGIAGMFHAGDSDAFFLPIKVSSQRFEESVAQPEILECPYVFPDAGEPVSQKTWIMSLPSSAT